MGKRIDYQKGQKFNRLTFIKEVQSIIVSNKKVRKALFKCDCGIEKEIPIYNVKNNQTKSCGCFWLEVVKSQKTNYKHGHYTNYKGSREYNSWQHMKHRCYNENNIRYNLYGGRGIKVCERWLNSFANFILDMGERAKGMSLDRINNDGNYEPLNCRWATAKEQANNRSNGKRS